MTMKKCPFCAKTIQADAVKCQFCGELHIKVESDDIVWAKSNPVPFCQKLPNAIKSDKAMQKKSSKAKFVTIYVVVAIVVSIIWFGGETNISDTLPNVPSYKISEIANNYISREQLQKIEERANAGEPYAQTLLGKLNEISGYRADAIRFTDYKEAAKWYKMAAKQGYAAAQSNLGVLYYNNKGVSEDYKEAFDLWTKASAQGYVEAKYWLGVMYSNGDGVPQNYEEAFKFFKMAAENGHSWAQYSLGVMYARGIGVSQNYVEAIKCYKMAADQGNPEAQYYLGECFLNGQGVPQDNKEAAEWFTKAEEQGHSKAGYFLGLMSNNHEYFGTAEFSDLHGFDNYKIKNPFRAKMTSGQVAETAYRQGNYYYVQFLNSAINVPAVKYYNKAAEMGHSGAQYRLSQMFDQGKFVSQNYEEALNWLVKAAKNGNSEAQYDLGVKYATGNGVLLNFNNAVELWTKSAEQGYADAQRELGEIYTKGQGVTTSYIEAYKWYLLAEMNGADVVKDRDSLRVLMTHEQVEEAQRLAKLFIERK